MYLSPQALCGVAGRVYWSVKGRVPCLVERVYLENGLLGVGVCLCWMVCWVRTVGCLVLKVPQITSSGYSVCIIFFEERFCLWFNGAGLKVRLCCDYNSFRGAVRACVCGSMRICEGLCRGLARVQCYLEVSDQVKMLEVIWTNVL